MTTSRFTPDDHVYDPSCPLPVGDGHGYKRAHQRGCRCPGPSLEDYRAYKAEEWARRRDRDYGGRIPIGSDWQHEARYPAVPDVPDLGKETKMVLNSDEPACVGYDPELWHPVGTNAHALSQTTYAKSICAGCSLTRSCLEAALSWDASGVWGGTTEAERRHLRAQRLRVAVAAA